MGVAVRKLVNAGDYTEAEAASGKVEQAILEAQKEFQEAMRGGNITGVPESTVGKKFAGLFTKLSKVKVSLMNHGYILLFVVT